MAGLFCKLVKGEKMETRTCKVCGQTKPVTEYYKHAGYYGAKCKECAKAYSREYERKHKEERIAYRKKYYAEHKEIMALKNKKWVENNREKHRQHCRKSNAAHSDQRLEYLREYRRRHPDKYKATAKINHLIEDGKLTKPNSCEVCGNVGRVEAHHRDYSKPLDVVWCCKKCHYKLDEERRQKERA